MSTSGSYNFQMRRADIIRHALDLVGALPSGQDPRPEQTARAIRSLNMVVQSLQTEGLRLWATDIDNRVATTSGGTLGTTLTASTATYYLPPETLEVMADGVVVRSSGVDTQLQPMSYTDYQKIGSKTTTGTPSQFLVEYNATATDTVVMQRALKITLFPVPNSSSLSLRYVRTRKLADFDSSSNDPDAPQKWLRLLVYGLAVEEAHRSGLSTNDRQLLKAEYEAEKARVLRDDTERGNVVLIPEIPVQRY